MTYQKTHEKVPFPAVLIFCLIMLSMISGCKSNPNIEQCVMYSDPSVPQSEHTIFCQNLKTGATRDITFEQANKYLMMSPFDYELMREWYKAGCESE